MTSLKVLVLPRKGQQRAQNPCMKSPGLLMQVEKQLVYENLAYKTDVISS